MSENYKSNLTGSVDCFGYLRWTLTSCRRCGHEQADCICIAGFAAPESPDSVMDERERF